MIRNPRQELPLSPMSGKGLAFLFFPGNEQYREMVRQRYPGGTEGESAQSSWAACVLHVRSRAWNKFGVILHRAK